MKKTLALILTVILAFSCFSICAVSPTAMAESTSTNLLADKTISDWLSGTSDHRVLDNASETTDSCYGGYAFTSTSAHYQGLRLTFSVKANTDYKLTFSAKSAAAWEAVSVLDISGLDFSGGKNTPAYEARNEAAVSALNANIATFDTAKWTDVTIEFTPTADSETYALYLAWAANTHGASVSISDLCLKALSTVPTYAEGNGAVKANPAKAVEGEEVTYTATPYQNDEFLGWYNGDALVSEVTTYTGTAFSDTTPTAKFTGTNLMGSTTYADWESDTNKVVVTDATAESRYGGKNSIKLSGIYRGTHTTLALVTGKEYTLSFSYYLSDHTTRDEESFQLYFGTDVVYNTETGEPSSGTWIYSKSFTEKDKWTDHSFPFTATADSADLVIIPGWSGGFILSDFSLTTKETVVTSAEGNGAVKANPASAYSGEEVTLTATAYHNDAFQGWYVDGEQVSTEPTYTVKAFVDTVPTARFTGTNLMGATTYADWESTSTEIDVTDATAESRYGGKNSIKLSGNYRGTHITLDLETGKDYTLSFSYYFTSHPTRDGEEIQFYLGADVVYNNNGLASNTVNWMKSVSINGTSLALDQWADYSFTFEATADSADLLINPGWNKGIILSDFSLTAKETVVTFAEGNGAVKANPASAYSGEEVTLTATAYHNDAFQGWYVDGEQVSTEATYTVKAFVDTVPTARFTSENLLADMTADGWYDENTPGYKDVYIVVDDASSESRYGGTAIKITKASAFRGTHMNLNLTPGKYRLQLQVNNPTDNAFENFAVVSNATYNETELNGKPNVKGAWQNLEAGTASDDGWVTYTKEITIEAGKTYDLYVGCADSCDGTIISDISLVAPIALETSVEGDGKVTTNPAGVFYGDTVEGPVTYTAVANEGSYFIGWYLNGEQVSTEAIYACETVPTAKFTAALANGEGNTEIGSFNGNAIRQTGKQGLRFSFNVTENDLTSSDFEGYTVKETGAVAIRNDYLGDAELKLGTANAKSVTFASEDISDEGVVGFRLYNIGVTLYSDGTVKSTDYTVYGTNLTVRLYKVLEKDGREIVVYGDAQTASVFDTMKAILDANTSETDVEAVNAMLASTTADTAGKTVQQAYDAYFAN